jgi:hypothetical protein
VILHPLHEGTTNDDNAGSLLDLQTEWCICAQGGTGNEKEKGKEADHGGDPVNSARGWDVAMKVKLKPKALDCVQPLLPR